MSQQSSPNVSPTGSFGEALSASASQVPVQPAIPPGKKAGNHSSHSGFVDSAEGSTSSTVSEQVKSIHAPGGQKKS